MNRVFVWFAILGTIKFIRGSPPYETDWNNERKFSWKTDEKRHDKELYHLKMIEENINDHPSIVVERHPLEMHKDKIQVAEKHRTYEHNNKKENEAITDHHLLGHRIETDPNRPIQKDEIRQNKKDIVKVHKNKGATTEADSLNRRIENVRSHPIEKDVINQNKKDITKKHKNENDSNENMPFDSKNEKHIKHKHKKLHGLHKFRKHHKEGKHESFHFKSSVIYHRPPKPRNNQENRDHYFNRHPMIGGIAAGHHEFKAAPFISYSSDNDVIVYT